jgi:tRNA threonylcarbamoyl adenosine modification protein YeaZ
VRILFLDVASRDGTIACVTPQRTIASCAIHTKISDAELPMLLEKTWRDAGWTPQDLTHVACITGPGGFMSLRVGVSSANAVAWALSLPVCGLHLSDLYAAQLTSSSLARRGEGVLWIHSTKKEEVFIRGFGVYAAMFPEARHSTLADLEGHLSGPFHFMGELIPEHEAWLNERGGQGTTLHPMTEILPGFLASQTYDRQTLQPWYGREG